MLYSANHPWKRVGVIRLVVMLSFAATSGLCGQESVPDHAKPWSQLDSEGVTAFVVGNTIWLKVADDVVKQKKVSIPRLCAPIRSIQWKGDSKAELKIRPAQQAWTFSWKEAPSQSRLLEIEFDIAPVLPEDCPVATPNGDGSIMLHSWQAKTYGEKILFEPQWYKNTVGYWAIDSDYATWNLEIDQPGTYSIAMLQGCGKGQGGSDAVVSLRQKDDVKARLPFKTIDTGHFQNFRWNHLGMLKVDQAGKYELRIDAERIAKAALFDVRAIHLVRQATAEEK